MTRDQYLIDFYNHYDEDSRLASRHGMVEFLTTMRYIERFLSPGDRILEIGAGTGRYSHALARKGFPVDAVELVPYNIAVFQEKTLSSEQITITQGNALDLGNFADESYDVTLLLGPLYHLYTPEDQDGLLDSETFAAVSTPKDIFELVRKEEIDQLLDPAPYGKDAAAIALSYAAKVRARRKAEGLD